MFPDQRPWTTKLAIGFEVTFLRFLENQLVLAQKGHHALLVGRRPATPCARRTEI